MIFPENFEKKIGFDSIRESLRNLCISPLGMAYIDKIRFSDKYETIKKHLEQTDEFRLILISGKQFPDNNYIDITSELGKLYIVGSFPETETLFNMKLSLRTITECISFFRNDNEDMYPRLKETVATIYLNPEIVKELDRIIDDRGHVRDDASAELLKIRKDLVAKQSQVNKRILQLITNVKKQGWAPENIEMTVRNGRIVIPVLAAFKRNLKGFVHDESASGQTVFIEPADVFEMNNDIRELENTEKREIINILTTFADMIRPEIEELVKCFRFLGLMDFIRAKAKYALLTESMKPILSAGPHVNWVKARHPLLFTHHKTQKKEVVPLNISLDDTSRILVISGPNAGGKSVCLKTIGLLQYMLQCGLLVPASDYSEAGIFSNIFIDIGDEQSLENDLSTYSSHLLNMRFFIERSNMKTLFLIDEFGTGTEPQLGGAIAESILEKLNTKKVLGVITTHYSNLKLLAGKQPGIINGAMLFDSENMKPLYILKTGKPGSSFAFEIAETIGLPKGILIKAKQKAGVKQVSFDRQLQNLDVQKKELDEKEMQVKAADDFLSEMIDKYEKLTETLEKSRKDILSKAKLDAAKLLENTNRIIENTIREIKENRAEKTVTKAAREKLADYTKKIQEIKQPENPNEEKKRKEKPAGVKIIQSPVEKGDYVRITGQDSIGEVVGIDARDVFVVFGTVQIKTKPDKLEKVSYEDFKVQLQKSVSGTKKPSLDINEKFNRFKHSIDLRGMRVDEALSAIQHYIDDAVLLNVSEVSILHGKGNGVLRHLVHQYLKTISEVRKFDDEALERGGHGITVVFFR